MKKAYIAIILSFPVGARLWVLLQKLGVFDKLEDMNFEGQISDIAYAFILGGEYAFTFGLPIITFIVYGIYNAAHTKDTVPRQKEPLPWEYRKGKNTPADSDPKDPDSQELPIPFHLAHALMYNEKATVSCNNIETGGKI